MEVLRRLKWHELRQLKDKFREPGLPEDEFEAVLLEAIRAKDSKDASAAAMSSSMSSDSSLKKQDQSSPTSSTSNIRFRELFNDIDVNGDESVSYDEFVSFIISSSENECVVQSLNSDAVQKSYQLHRSFSAELPLSITSVKLLQPVGLVARVVRRDKHNWMSLLTVNQALSNATRKNVSILDDDDDGRPPSSRSASSSSKNKNNKKNSGRRGGGDSSSPPTKEQQQEREFAALLQKYGGGTSFSGPGSSGSARGATTHALNNMGKVWAEVPPRDAQIMCYEYIPLQRGVANSNSIVLCYNDNSASVYDLTRTIGLPGQPKYVKEKEIRLKDGIKLPVTYHFNEPQKCIAWGSRLRHLFFGSNSGVVTSWDPDLPSPSGRERLHERPVTKIVASTAEYTTLFTASLDKHIKSVDMTRGLIKWDVDLNDDSDMSHKEGVLNLYLDEDHHQIATTGLETYVLLHSTTNPITSRQKLNDPMRPHKTRITQLFCPDDLHHQLISADSAGVVKIWDLRMLSCIQTIDLGRDGDEAGVAAAATDSQQMIMPGEGEEESGGGRAGSTQDDVKMMSSGSGSSGSSNNSKRANQLLARSITSSTFSIPHRLSSIEYFPGHQSLMLNGKETKIFKYSSCHAPSMSDESICNAVLHNPASRSVMTFHRNIAKKWDGETGCLRGRWELFPQRNIEVTSACLAFPRMRKFFIGTTNGIVRSFGFSMCTELVDLPVSGYDLATWGRVVALEYLDGFKGNQGAFVMIAFARTVVLVQDVEDPRGVLKIHGMDAVLKNRHATCLAVTESSIVLVGTEGGKILVGDLLSFSMTQEINHPKIHGDITSISCNPTASAASILKFLRDSEKKSKHVGKSNTILGGVDDNNSSSSEDDDNEIGVNNNKNKNNMKNISNSNSRRNSKQQHQEKEKDEKYHYQDLEEELLQQSIAAAKKTRVKNFDFFAVAKKLLRHNQKEYGKQYLLQKQQEDFENPELDENEKQRRTIYREEQHRRGDDDLEVTNSAFRLAVDQVTDFGVMCAVSDSTGTVSIISIRSGMMVDFVKLWKNKGERRRKPVPPDYLKKQQLKQQQQQQQNQRRTNTTSNSNNNLREENEPKWISSRPNSAVAAYFKPDPIEPNSPSSTTNNNNNNDTDELLVGTITTHGSIRGVNGLPGTTIMNSATTNNSSPLVPPPRKLSFDNRNSTTDDSQQQHGKNTSSASVINEVIVESKPTVTAMCVLHSCPLIVTGDERGNVTVWLISGVTLPNDNNTNVDGMMNMNPSSTSIPQQQQHQTSTTNILPPISSTSISSGGGNNNKYVSNSSSSSSPVPPAPTTTNTTNAAAAAEQQFQGVSTLSQAEFVTTWRAHTEEVSMIRELLGEQCAGPVIMTVGMDKSIYMWSTDGTKLGAFAQGRTSEVHSKIEVAKAVNAFEEKQQKVQQQQQQQSQQSQIQFDSLNNKNKSSSNKQGDSKKIHHQRRKKKQEQEQEQHKQQDQQESHKKEEHHDQEKKEEKQEEEKVHDQEEKQEQEQEDHHQEEQQPNEEEEEKEKEQENITSEVAAVMAATTITTEPASPTASSSEASSPALSPVSSMRNNLAAEIDHHIASLTSSVTKSFRALLHEIPEYDLARVPDSAWSNTVRRLLLFASHQQQIQRNRARSNNTDNNISAFGAMISSPTEVSMTMRDMSAFQEKKKETSETTTTPPSKTVTISAAKTKKEQKVKQEGEGEQEEEEPHFTLDEDEYADEEQQEQQQQEDMMMHDASTTSDILQDASLRSRKQQPGTESVFLTESGLGDTLEMTGSFASIISSDRQDQQLQGLDSAKRLAGVVKEDYGKRLHIKKSLTVTPLQPTSGQYGAGSVKIPTSSAGISAFHSHEKGFSHSSHPHPPGSCSFSAPSAYERQHQHHPQTSRYQHSAATTTTSTTKRSSSNESRKTKVKLPNEEIINISKSSRIRGGGRSKTKSKKQQHETTSSANASDSETLNSGAELSDTNDEKEEGNVIIDDKNKNNVDVDVDEDDEFNNIINSLWDTNIVASNRGKPTGATSVLDKMHVSLSRSSMKRIQRFEREKALKTVNMSEPLAYSLTGRIVLSGREKSSAISKLNDPEPSLRRLELPPV